jgi:hypothetical protein
MPWLGLVKRKEVWLPTWRGWLLLLGTATAAGILAVVTPVPFLAPVQPLSRGVLVVEGWIPDYALEEAKAVFESHSYQCMVVTGVPIDQGYHISKEKDYAHLAQATLKQLGMKPEAVVPVACPETLRDRTYSTAQQVRAWLDSNSMTDTVDVFTLGVHARRTWLLYRMALGQRYTTGVIAGQDRRYDCRRWWRSSSGFRTVTSEVIAYLYAKFLFFPGPSGPAELRPQ